MLKRLVKLCFYLLVMRGFVNVLRTYVLVAHTVNYHIVNATLEKMLVRVIMPREAHCNLIESRLFVSAPDNVLKIVDIIYRPVAHCKSCVGEDEATLVGGVKVRRKPFKLLGRNVAVEEVLMELNETLFAFFEGGQ